MIRELYLQYRYSEADLKRLQGGIGSIVNSLFMEHLREVSPELSEALHTRDHQLRPYRLSWPLIEASDNTLSWSIVGLTESMCECLSEFAKQPPKELTIKQNNCELKLTDCSLKTPLSYSELVKQSFNAESDISGLWELEFKGPTTFNWAANKHYLPLPDPKLILNSALQKWNSFAPDHSLEDEDLLNQCLSMLHINSVYVRPRHVKQSGRFIPCFTGATTWQISRNDAVAKLLAILLTYMPHCGLGAKCALGLGEVKLTRKENK